MIWRLYFITLLFSATGDNAVNTILTSTAITSCSNTCKSASPGNVYAALRRTKSNQFKCKCLSTSFDGVLGESISHSPTYYVNCPDGSDPYKADFEADTNLVNWLTTSTLGLWKKVGGQNNDTLQRKNICNPTRKADVATLYLTRALGLSVSSIISSFVFDENKVYVFPNSSSKPNVIYAPTYIDLLYYWPELDQTYWTIMSQYTSQTEPTMRTRDRADYWCWIVGMGMYDHCLEKAAATSCTEDHETMCKGYWRYFVEACHRVHTINPTGAYSLTASNGAARPTNWICQPSKTGYKLYQLYRM